METNYFQSSPSFWNEHKHLLVPLFVLLALVLVLSLLYIATRIHRGPDSLDRLSEIEKNSAPVDLNVQKRAQELEALKASSKPVTLTEEDRSQALELLRQRR